MEPEREFNSTLRFSFVGASMYTNYFGLKEKPFSIAPDPRYLYMSERHREALAHLLYGVSSDGCFILLTGDVGTGKTTVGRCFLAQLPDNTDVAFIVNPRLTVLELLETICEEFGIPLDSRQQSVKLCIDKLNIYLLEAHASGRNSALLIDEAQSLSLALLEQLRLLTNLETNQKKLLKIMLLGQSELRHKLKQKEAAQINQRITSRYHLLPLDRTNCFSYILHRLAVAGERQKVFSKNALNRIFLFSGGIPRIINILCDRSLLGTYVDGEYLVSAKVVDKAAREVLGDDSKDGEQAIGKRLWPKIIFAVFAFLFCASGVLYYLDSMTPVLQLPRFQSTEAGNVSNLPVVVPITESVTEEPQDVKTEESETITIIPLEIVE